MPRPVFSRPRILASLASAALLATSVGSAAAQTPSACPPTFLEGTDRTARTFGEFFDRISTYGSEAWVFLDWYRARAAGNLDALKGRPWAQWKAADWQALLAVLRGTMDTLQTADFIRNMYDGPRKQVLDNFERKIAAVDCFARAAEAAAGGKPAGTGLGAESQASARPAPPARPAATAFKPKDPQANHEGQACSYFTRPAVEADGARLNYYANGAWAAYGKWMYRCENRRWVRAGPADAWQDAARYQAERQERRGADPDIYQKD